MKPLHIMLALLLLGCGGQHAVPSKRSPFRTA